jgi:hypothetical protein
MVNRLVGSLLLSLPLVAGGCQALEGLIPGTKAGEVVRVPGQWQKTYIGVQKYNNAVLRNKANGRVLDPEDAREMPMDAYTVEAGDIEELTYRAGRLRYSFTPREKDAQPFVVERPIDEKEFDAFDAALYQDKFFGLAEKNWATERFPMFYVQYDQGGKGHKASFTPNLNRIMKTGALITSYFGQLGGQDKLTAGTKQYAYYLNPAGSNLKVAISTLVGTKNGEAEDKPWTIKAATYDTGKGFQNATVEADGQSITLPMPAGDGSTLLMGLKVTAEGDPGTWETLIPVRTAK